MNQFWSDLTKPSSSTTPVRPYLSESKKGPNSMRNLISFVLPRVIILLGFVFMHKRAMKSIESPAEMIAYSRLRKATFESREDARTVLSEARAIAKKYGNVTLADILSLSGVETRFVDESVSWDNLNRAYIIRTSHGHRLVLGKPSEA